MYRHFRLTPYTNHYKYSAFQDSRLEFVSLFPRVDTRLIPHIVKYAIDLRYLHTIYILYTILQYDTPNSSKSKSFKHTIYTIHTPYKTHTFFSLYSPFLSLLSSIILLLFFLLYLLIIRIILWPTTYTLPSLSIPQTPPIHPTHSLPSTYV